MRTIAIALAVLALSACSGASSPSLPRTQSVESFPRRVSHATARAGSTSVSSTGRRSTGTRVRISATLRPSAARPRRLRRRRRHRSQRRLDRAQPAGRDDQHLQRAAYVRTDRSDASRPLRASRGRRQRECFDQDDRRRQYRGRRTDIESAAGKHHALHGRRRLHGESHQSANVPRGRRRSRQARATAGHRPSIQAATQRLIYFARCAGKGASPPASRTPATEVWSSTRAAICSRSIRPPRGFSFTPDAGRRASFVAGPFALQGLSLYGKVNAKGTTFAAADYASGQSISINTARRL